MEANEKVNLLLVDDRPENLLALVVTLERLGENLITASSGREALKRLQEDDFAAVLLDVQMPEMDGFETAALIRAAERSRSTPIIFITAIGKADEQISRGYSLGAVDYIMKPVVPEILRSKVAVFADLFRKAQQVRRLNETLKRRTVELEDANRQLQTFSHSVSHDLRAPLRAIVGFSQILCRRHEESPDWEERHYLDNIARASMQMEEQIDALLTTSRLDRPSSLYQPAAIADLLNQVATKLALKSETYSETAAKPSHPTGPHSGKQVERIVSDLIRILYLDNNPFDRELVRHSLVDEYGGFQIAEVSSRAEFEAQLSAGGYDVVLSDFHALGFDGPDVIDLVRSSHSTLPIVILTGTGSEMEAVEAMKRGAADYVIKTPDHILRLPSTILATLERRRMHEEHLRAQDAQRFLVEASAVLASSLDYEATLRRLVHMAVPGLADLCAIRLLDDKSVGGVMTVILDPNGQRLVNESWHPWRGSTEWRETMWSLQRSGRHEIIERPSEQLLAAFAVSPEQLGLLRNLDISSAIAIPVVARGRNIGALLLGRLASSPAYSNDDLSLADELAGRIALSVENARLYREAREAIRMRDEFLAMAAHELRTPVTSLKGFAQLTAKLIDKEGEAIDLDQVRQAMKVINQQSDRLTQMMTQLLDISRIEARRLALELESTEVVGLVNEAADKIRVSNGGRTISVNGPASAVAIIDPLRLDQVLNNLLDNAVKYSPETKPVEIIVEVPSPDTIRIAVRDYGSGIPPERREQIFDRFYQAHGDGALGGMGLGLYISKHIVELHGGTIELNCPESGGSCFTVTLPTGIQEDLTRHG